MIKYFFLILILPLHIHVMADSLPVKEWIADKQNPFVLYISGDGGLNGFSLNLCNSLNQSGYSVSAINARSYFWNKKTPEKSAQDITMYLNQKLNLRENQDLVLVGYSFGADVLPFIIQKLPLSVRSKIRTTILISPSITTDFEIHLSDLFGFTSKRNMDVVDEINKLSGEKVVTVFGEKETGFPVNKIRLNKHANITLPGDHHLDGDIGRLVRALLEYF